MKTISMLVCAVATVVIATSCCCSKKVLTLADINGEWYIIKVGGVAITPHAGTTIPFIAFDAVEHKVSGNAGCNQLSGVLNPSAQAGQIDLSKLVATRKMCLDMSIENAVMAALREVTGYVRVGKNDVALCDAANKQLILLQKKQ